MIIIYFLLQVDNELKYLGSTGHNNGFGPHRKFRNMDSGNFTQFSIITAVTSLYRAYQSSLNALNSILLELHSSNPPTSLHSILRAEAGFSCQWEHGTNTARQRLSFLPTSTLPTFYYQKEKKPQDFCLSIAVAMDFRNLCLHPTVEKPPLHTLLILVSMQDLKMTQKGYQFKFTGLPLTSS